MPPPGRLPRGSLDRERIVTAAWDLCGRRGVSGLTMQGVAAHLNVQASAVHWHFPKKQLLVDALYAEAVERFNLLLPAHDERPWHEQIRHYWQSFRSILRKDPTLCDLIVGEWTSAAGASDALADNYRRIDTQLGLLVAAGFTPEAAARTYHLMSTYTRGCLLNERQAATAARTRPTSDDGPAMGVDLTWLPNLEAAAPYWTFSFASTKDFEYGLDVLIGGLQAALRHQQATGRRKHSR
jgi:TetR/AcrR family tetracycline transcriptional repressor